MQHENGNVHVTGVSWRIEPYLQFLIVTISCGFSSCPDAERKISHNLRASAFLTGDAFHSQVEGEPDGNFQLFCGAVLRNRIPVRSFGVGI